MKARSTFATLDYPLLPGEDYLLAITVFTKEAVRDAELALKNVLLALLYELGFLLLERPVTNRNKVNHGPTVQVVREMIRDVAELLFHPFGKPTIHDEIPDVLQIDPDVSGRLQHSHLYVQFRVEMI